MKWHEDIFRDWSDWSISQRRPRISGKYQKEGGRCGQDLKCPPEELTLPTPWLGTSGPLNCKRMNFSCFKPLSLWSFVLQQLQETNTSRKHNLRQRFAIQDGAVKKGELQCICNIGPWLTPQEAWSLHSPSNIFWIEEKKAEPLIPCINQSFISCTMLSNPQRQGSSWEWKMS